MADVDFTASHITPDLDSRLAAEDLGSEYGYLTPLDIGSLLGVSPAEGVRNLSAFDSKLYTISTGASATARVMIIGDSIGADAMLSMMTALWAAHGNGGGQRLGPQMAVTTNTAGGVTTSTPADYTKWIGGAWSIVPAAGTITILPASTGGAFASPVSTQAVVNYLKDPANGTFKIQTSPDGGVWTDVGTTRNTAAAAGFDQYKVAITGAIQQVRMIGVSGTCNILSVGWETAAGVHYAFDLGNGGKDLKDYILTPAPVWASYLTVMAPDFILVGFKDLADAAFIAALDTMQGYISASCPNAETVYVSAYDSVSDSAAMAAQADALRALVMNPAISGRRYFWNGNDVYGGYPHALALGAMQDTIHMNDLGRYTMATAFMRDFGLLSGLRANWFGNMDAATISRLGLVAAAGGTITGTVVLTNTTDATGINYTLGAGALRVAGGVYAAKAFRTDLGLGIGSDLNASNQITMVRSGATGFTSLSSTNTVANTASASQPGIALFGSVTLSPTSTFNNTSFASAGLAGQCNTSGAGTGTINAVQGVTGSPTHASSHVVANLNAFGGTVTASGSGNTTASAGLSLNFSKSGAGVVATSYGIRILNTFDGFTATAKWAIYNDNAAPCYLGTGNTSVGSLSVTGAATVTGAVIAGAQVRLKGYTVATLPAGTVGDTAYVTDALAPTFLAVLVGGGSVVTTAFYNGTNWVAR